MYIVRAEKGGMYKEQQFAAYQQTVGNVNLNTDMPIPTPTPTPGPTAAQGTGTPGFEAIAALIAGGYITIPLAVWIGAIR
jgi:hypothetical protein